MKITILHGGCFPVPPVKGGGVEKAWHQLGIAFAKNGHEVTQISRFGPGNVRREIIDGVTHFHYPGYDTPEKFLSLLVKEFFYAIRVVRLLPPADILVTHSIWAPIFARRKTTGKLYVHVARFPKGQMRFYSHADRLQGVSQAVGKAIEREVPHLKNKISVIPYPHGQEHLFSEMFRFVPPSQRENEILYVGRLHPEKGISLLIESFCKSLPTIGRNWKLVLVGPWSIEGGGGGDEYFKQLQKKCGQLSGNIEFRGPAFNPVVLGKIYRKARIFVYPSLAERGETFGLSPLEAMTHGCPIIVSDLDCFHDFIFHERNGIFFNHKHGNGLAGLTDAIIAMAQSPETQDAFSKESQNIALNFSLEKIAEAYIKDFFAVLRGQPGSVYDFVGKFPSVSGAVFNKNIK